MKEIITKSNATARLTMGTAILGGIAYASVTAYLALNVAGGGHGWNSAIISALGLILIPVAAASAVSRRHGGSKIWSLMVLASIGLVDFGLTVLTIREGFEYVGHTIKAAPVLVLLWAVMWFGWQVAFVMKFFINGGTSGLKGASSAIK